MLKAYRKRLLETASNPEHPYSKSYTYGCFQALLSQRLFPGWQQLVTSGSGFIDAYLAGQLPITSEEKSQIQERLKTSYPVAEIRERNAKYLDARNSAYRQMKSRSGKAYVVDFKPIGQYVSTVATTKGSYSMAGGLIYLYPAGLDPIKFDDVELSRIEAPAEISQLYYVRAIDTWDTKGAVSVRIEGIGQPDGSWRNATVRTPLFTLKAPHVRVTKSGNLMKIQVLSRVK